MKLLSFLFLIFTLTACKEDEWIGLLYKDERVMSQYSVFGRYKDRQTCLDIGRKTASVYEYGAFECGLNCELRGGDLYVCEKTVDE